MTTLPNVLIQADATNDETKFSEAVSKLSLFELEDISISEISSLKNGTLKDLLNDAVRSRLEFHLGGSYTSPI